MKKLGPVIGILLAMGALFVLIGFCMGATRGDEETEKQYVSEPDTAPFTSINLNMVSHDIEFVASERYGIEITNNSNTEVTWSLQDGRLTIKEESKRKILGFGFLRNIFKGGSSLKIYLPADADLGEVSIKNVSGKITIADLDCTLLRINVVSGKTEISRITVDRLIFEGVSGRLTTHQCRAESVKVSIISGDSSFSVLKSGSLSFDTVSGGIDISGELLGYNDIKAISGNVRLNVSGKPADYNKQVSLLSGRLRINGQNFGKNYSENTGAPNSLKIDTVSGDVDVDFFP